MDVHMHHVAVTCPEKGSADLFFGTILELPLVKSSMLSASLSRAIFGLESGAEMAVYDNGRFRVEVFIAGGVAPRGYAHTCVAVSNREALAERCRQHNLPVTHVQKEGKDVLFVRDFAGNLYEVKEHAPEPLDT